MKTLTLSLITSLFLVSSCGNDTFSSPDQKNVIRKITKHNDGTCSYYGEGYTTGVFTNTDFRLIDTCGKFNVGDTIRLIK